MLDKLLNIGCTLNWITPTIAFIQDALRGPIGDFGIPANSGWSRKEIKQLLMNQGVQVWGLIYNISGNTLMFTVQKQDAELVYTLLEWAGVPVLYAPIDPMNFELQNESANLYTYSDEIVPSYPENIEIEF